MQYKNVFVGLGNPGPKFHNTRHNMGFMLIDYLLEKAQEQGQIEELAAGKFKCQLWRVKLNNNMPWLLFVKPQTFMNLSGLCVQPLLAWHKLTASDLIVLHDELDIGVGQLRFKFGGGNAGHNGLKSINQQLGTPDFYRLRLGIGRPANAEHMDISSYVLTRPSLDEQSGVDSVFPKACEVLDVFMMEGLKAATAHALAFR